MMSSSRVMKGGRTKAASIAAMPRRLRHGKSRRRDVARAPMPDVSC